jgi:hypothetical protein
MIDGKDDKGGESLETKLDALNGDEQLEPVEIEIGADGAGTVIETTAKAPAADADEDPDRPKLKRKGQGRFNKRLGEISGERDEALRGQELLRQENERLRKESEEAKKRASQADEVALSNYEARCKAEADKTEKELADAIESGDKDKIAKATMAATKAGAELGRVEAYRKSQPAKKEADGDDDDKGADTSKADQRRDPPQRNPGLDKFIQENPWFAPGTQQSPNPDYRLALHAYAMDYGRKLEIQYQQEGKAIDQAYWDKIAEATEKKFPEEFEGDGGDDDEKPAPKAKTPTMRSDGDHIGRQSAQTGNNGSKTTERVKLTLDQMQLVHANIDNGIYVHPDGKPYSRQEGYVRYGKALADDRRKQAMEKGQ